MSLQKQPRLSSEVRGCLLRNFLDIRKRSLIRSESEDSGFSLESYEPFMNSSFDAEKFLEELGFAASNAPLIPDRFIPSLIHRISNMPDETVLKLDTRVWNSIDSFKKKERTLWFFTQSGVECDLCINDLQRSYSVPAGFEQGSFDFAYPDNDIYAVGNSNSTSASRVENWLSRFDGGSRSVDDKTKANIAYIGNQSSTESGILSALSDDEAFTAANSIEGFNANDSCCPPKRIDDLEQSKSKLLSLKPTTGMVFKKRRTSKAIPNSTLSNEVRDNGTINANTALCLEIIPSSNYKISETLSLSGASTSGISPASEGQKYFDENRDNEHSFSVLNRTDSIEPYGHCKFDGENDNENPTENVSCNKRNMNSVQICSQENVDSDTENVFHSTPDSKSHYVNGEDFYSYIWRTSTPKTSSVTSFDSTKKRHSFDSACLTADEKRKRFRLSHSKTHNALFEKTDSNPSVGRLNEITTDTVLCDSVTFRSSHEETKMQHFDKLKPQKEEYDIQGIAQNSRENSSDNVNYVDISHQNGSSENTTLETSDIVSNVDIRRHNIGNVDTPLEVSAVLNSVEQSIGPQVLLKSDSESSEHYFSCDEPSITKTLEDDVFIEHDNGEEEKEIRVALVPCLTTEQRVALFRNYNRMTYAKYKEHFILNKILKRCLKFSILCPIEKMSRHSLLENDRTDNETFSQILNSPSSSSKSKVLEKPSVTYGKSVSNDASLNFSTRKKSVGSISSDKAGEFDNKSIISKPFVHNRSLSSDMFAPKCEVRLINYDGLALFWATRSKAEGNSISCNSEFTDLVNSNSDNTINKRFINGVYMDVNSGNETDSTNTKVYFSEVRLEVNSEVCERDPEEERLERYVAEGKFQSEENTKKETPDKNFPIFKTPKNSESPCGRALKDLEDLKNAIRKAKETRLSASKELKLIQELLQNGDNEDETALGRTSLAMSESKLSLPNVEIINENIGKGKTVEALSEIQQKSSKEASQNKEFWEGEIRKAKDEASQVLYEKLSAMEEKLRTTEDELARALKENNRLKDQLELRSAAFPTCKCNAEAQQNSDYCHMNGILDEDPKVIPVVKPSVPTKNFWQEWDRLQSDLMKAERRADELNILLNQKLIELNRMQLTLSKQTKEMILLEKAYFQLRSHLSKRKLNKSGSSHQSSSVVKTLSSKQRPSETSSKMTDPEIPP